MTNSVLAASSPETAAPVADNKRVDGGSKTPVSEYLPLAAAVIALGGIYWAHRLSKRREAIARFHAQAVKFREAFAADLAAIENDNLGHLDLMDYMRSAYNARHAAAVAVFEGFVPAGKLGAFRDDWNRYRYGENEDGSPAVPDEESPPHSEMLLLCYYGPGPSWERHLQLSGYEKAMSRIRKLLSYASEA